MADGEITVRTATAHPRGAGSGVLGEVGHLVSPRFRAARNRARRMTRADRTRSLLLSGLGVLFGLAIFAFFHRVLAYFLAAEDFGAVLTYKLLGMVFITFFSILLFSNIVTSLSTFYLSPELDRMVAAPVRRRSFFYARLIETMIESSWMLLLFSLPAFLAYGIVHGSGPGFYLATIATLPPFIIIPAAIGWMVTSVLVNVFPARRTRDILFLLSIVAVALLYLVFRMIRPERLVNPEGFSDFMAYLAAMRTPDAAFLPSTWATEILYSFLGIDERAALFYYALLATTACVSVIVAEGMFGALYLTGWSKAQEGRRARLTQRPLWERAMAVLTSPFDAQTRLLMAKELKTFFRDTSQWSQLILLLALVIVYVYNFRALPYGQNPLIQFYFKNVVSFLNLALAGFVVAAVTVRFAFPSFSLEGKAFWILKTAPLSLRRLWWAKYFVNALPLIVLGETLVVATNMYLQVIPFMMWLSAITLLGIILAIVMLALAVGATYPRFDAENAAKIAAGAGGLIYMILCMSFIGVVVILEAWPVYLVFSAQFRGEPLSLFAVAAMAVCFTLVAILIVAVTLGSMWYGLRRLERLVP